MLIDVNLMAAVFLGIVFFLAYQRLDHEDAFNKLFFKGCLIILVMTLFEAFTCVMNRNPSPVLRWISTAMHVLLFTFPPVLAYYWGLLANTLTTHGNVREMKGSWPCMLPIVFVCMSALISPFSHLVYYIDAAGVYHRGPLFLVSAGITYLYLLTGFTLLIIRRKKLLRMDFYLLMLSCLLPMVGGLIQGLVYGVLLLWASSAIALVIMYLYLQERMVQTDSLTGAWTRHSFEYCVSQNLICNHGKPFGLIYADIDNLKTINDGYGHGEGDAAIKAAVGIIKGALRKGDAVARLGGDEFAILLNIATREELHMVAGRIESAVRQYNDTSGKEYRLSLSLGVDLFWEDGDANVDSVIRRVDRLMYDNKQAKRRRMEDVVQ